MEDTPVFLSVQGASRESVYFALERELQYPSPSRSYARDRRLRPRKLSERELNWVRPMTDIVLDWWGDTSSPTRVATRRAIYGTEDGQKSAVDTLLWLIKSDVQSRTFFSTLEWWLLSKLAIQVILLLLQWLLADDQGSELIAT